MVREAPAQSLIAAALAIGCSPIPITQLVVVIDSDLVIPTELSVVTLELEEPPEPPQGPFAQTVDPGEADAVGLPVTVTLRSRSDPTREVTVVAGAAERVGVMPSFEQRARVHFTRDEAHVLCMHLNRACEHVPCGESQTCVDGLCVPDNSFELPLYREGFTCDQTVIDGGLPDAAADAAVDAAIDAAIDGGRDGG